MLWKQRHRRINSSSINPLMNPLQCTIIIVFEGWLFCTFITHIMGVPSIKWIAIWHNLYNRRETFYPSFKLYCCVASYFYFGWSPPAWFSVYFSISFFLSFFCCFFVVFPFALFKKQTGEVPNNWLLLKATKSVPIDSQVKTSNFKDNINI